MQTIIPHLWYDTQAKEAAAFYTTLFEDSAILETAILADTPSGDTELVHFKLAGMEFAAISAGPYFKLNPAISLAVSCNSKDEIDRKWQTFLDGGKVLMTLQAYPFQSYYGWIEDRYGLSWQLMLVPESENQIVPSLLFSQEAWGKAYEAISFYKELFHDAKINAASFYPEEAKEQAGKLQFASFTLCNQAFTAMDHGLQGDFTFNEAFSLMVNCQTQEEIDYYWNTLSADPEAEQCGWLKDRFGVSWQIVYDKMNDLMYQGTKEEVERVTQAFMEMKKLDIAVLEQARKGV